MKLERVEPCGNTGKVKLYFSDGTSMRVPAAVYADSGLRTGSELTEEELAALSDKAGLASAKQRAVRILASSGTSERELRRKLLAKGESAEHVNETVSWLEDLDLIDDRSAAKLIAERAHAKGYGPNRIKDVLYQKGIPPKLREEAMADLPGYSESVLRFLKAHHASASCGEDEKRKLIGALQRRGFTYEQIRTGFRSLDISSDISSDGDD